MVVEWNTIITAIVSIVATGSAMSPFMIKQKRKAANLENDKTKLQNETISMQNELLSTQKENNIILQWKQFCDEKIQQHKEDVEERRCLQEKLGKAYDRNSNQQKEISRLYKYIDSATSQNAKLGILLCKEVNCEKRIPPLNMGVLDDLNNKIKKQEDILKDEIN